MLAKLPFDVERIQTDNGQEFGSALHLPILGKGIGTSTSSTVPRWSTLKVEGSHQIDSEGFYRLLKGQDINDAQLFTEKFQEWEDYYNYHRPNGALGGQTLYKRLRQKTQDPLS